MMPTKTTASAAGEEIQVLPDAERVDLIASLKRAQAEMAAGDYMEFKPGDLEPWLLGELANARRRQNKNGV